MNEALNKSLTNSLYKSLKESTSRALKQRLREALPLSKPLTNSVKESLNISLSKSLYKSLKESLSKSLNISLEKSLKKSLKSSLNESLIFYKGKERYDISKLIIEKVQKDNFSSLNPLGELLKTPGSKTYSNHPQLLITNRSTVLRKLDMRPFNMQLNIKDIKENKPPPFVPDEMISFNRHEFLLN